MKETLLAVLRDPHTAKIGFDYKNDRGVRYRISPADFPQVARAVEDGRINVVEGGTTGGVDAEYSLRKANGKEANTFYIKPPTASRNVFRSLLVHETVHAFHDLSMLQMPWLDAEIIAYIAQGFYIMSAGEDGGLSDPAYVGLEIARDFSKGVTDSSWIDLLKNALLTDIHYQNYITGAFRGDG